MSAARVPLNDAAPPAGLGGAELDDLRRLVYRQEMARRTPQAIQAEVVQAWRDTAAHPAGQIVIRDLLTMTGVTANLHVPGDPDWTHVNVGRHGVGIDVLARLAWGPDELTALQQRLTESQIDRWEQAASAAPAQEMDYRYGGGDGVSS